MIRISLLPGAQLAFTEARHYSIRYSQSQSEGHVERSIRTLAPSRNETEFKENLPRQVAIITNEYGVILSFQVVRFIRLSLHHATRAGIVGWFIGIAVMDNKPIFHLTAIGIITTAILHGCYDLLSGDVGGELVGAVSGVLLMSYVMKIQLVETKRARVDLAA
jgi:hypothetical protein